MSFWSFFIGLGDSALTIPLALGIALALAFQRAVRPALTWLLAFGIGLAVIAAGKLAFALFGWSLPAFDFYVISGHAMLTAAVYPMLFGSLVRASSPRMRRMAIITGLALAAAMAVILVTTLQHTLSETLLGSLVGLMVAFIGLRKPTAIRIRPAALAAFIPLSCLVLLNATMPVHAAMQGLWHHLGAQVGASGKYIRYIEFDTQAGKPVVVIIPPKNPPRGRKLSASYDLGQAT